MTDQAKPNINVTPLIDVLLVLLIIFMVIAPSKPSAFKAKVPAAQQQSQPVEPHPYTLIVKINPDASLALNREEKLGTITEPQKLMAKLGEVFAWRAQNRIYDDSLAAREDLSEDEKILRTVFIKAPKNFAYGEVAKVVDAVKQTGANPVGLQTDALE